MDWKRHIIIFLFIFLLVVVLTRPGGGCPAQGPSGPPAETVELTVAPSPAREAERLAAASFTIEAEVADTRAERGQGLVGRPGLAPGYGMLYVYGQPSTPTFDWSGMKFPVSAAFLDADGRILSIQQAEAGRQAPYTPEQPIRYALEVRKGWFEDRGIAPGDRVVLPPEVTGDQPPAPSEGESEAEAPPEAPADGGD